MTWTFLDTMRTFASISRLPHWWNNSSRMHNLIIIDCQVQCCQKAVENSRDRVTYINYISWRWHLHYCQTMEGNRMEQVTYIGWQHGNYTYIHIPTHQFPDISWLPHWWNNSSNRRSLIIIDCIVKLSIGQLSNAVLSENKWEHIMHISWGWQVQYTAVLSNSREM